MPMKKTLIVLLGPTGIGKTELSLSLAEHLGCPILNCDSRQLFRDLKIGTAAPTEIELSRATHYFVGILGLEEYYSAAQYESDALALLDELFKQYNTVLLSGGSMLYIDAVCKGIDDIPTIDESTRTLMKERLDREGLESLCEELRRLDPEYYSIVDKHNTRRIVHALEICHMTGQTYTSFRTSGQKQRPFNIVKIGLQRPREELFEYIDNKDKPDAEKRALQIKGHIATLQDAIERIKKNTRVYAKKQMTWFAKDEDIAWFHPSERQAIIHHIEERTTLLTPSNE